MDDRYPSTTDHQSVHLDYTYPDAERELNRWLTLVKWFLAIPHYVVLFFLHIALVVVVIIAWFAILFTGHYPSLHGVTQTTGVAKEPFEDDQFWLDPDTVPTMGDYFRAAGYDTFYKGKWHLSDADMLIPGTHEQLVSFDANGVPDPAAEQAYLDAERLDEFGFSGWIGPEPHGKNPLNSGSSPPAGQQGRDEGFAQQVIGRVHLATADDLKRLGPPYQAGDTVGAWTCR